MSCRSARMAPGASHRSPDLPQLVLLQPNIVVFRVRVMPVRKAPCAGNGRCPWQARQRGGRVSRERPSGGSVSAPGPRCASWQGLPPLPARRALPGTRTDPLNTAILGCRSTRMAGRRPAGCQPCNGSYMCLHRSDPLVKFLIPLILFIDQWLTSGQSFCTRKISLYIRLY